VVPTRRSVAGSGVALRGGETLAKPSASATTRKECDPGVSPNKKAAEPESKLLQLLPGKQGSLKFESRRVSSSSTKKKDAKEPDDEDSPGSPDGIVDRLTLRLWEKVNGNVTVEAFWLTMFAWAIAAAKERALEGAGPPAKPVTSAVALPGGDTEAVAAAMALPLNCSKGNMLPGKKEILVPDGNGPGVEIEVWTRIL
jgi:hypothetical protein